MSSPERRKILEARFRAECEAREVEQRRIANLSDYERIEEIGDFSALKDFLHILSARTQEQQP